MEGSERRMFLRNSGLAITAAALADLSVSNSALTQAADTREGPKDLTRELAKFIVSTRFVGRSVLQQPAQQIVRLTMRDRIPTVFPWRQYVVTGGLLSYGTSLGNTYRQAAGYVARILKGAKPSELPAQLPRFEFVLNLRAKALGLTIPPLILVHADEVIE